ncbi:MAG: bifunctional serine/threonine-protein kinase/ABC transporter substrate-binding protein [Xenococcaceae cyanobacterium MO_167.B52]|nr:bifunctional serine/threonine-protein kinase/ABC transporter substrate-binding protein [Xenococcaceae cyanobacterium MO_167.B52]
MNSALSKGNIILNGRYHILHQLGQGGFARAYLAEDINRFKEKCVLKEFTPKLKTNSAIAKAHKLFQQEAEILYRLENRHIPKFRELFRFDYHNKTRLFLAQDYIEGQTYSKLLEKRYSEAKCFSQEEIEKLLYQLIPVLEYIHSLGVIHRDISPENIMLRSSDQRAMLIDFGCIKDAANKAESLVKGTSKKDLLFQGTILGKAGYAPPEQIVSGAINYHSDLYALAATSVVLLTGRKPQELIDSCDFQWHLQKHLNLNPKLCWVLNKMLAPHPNDRFPTATQAMQALEDVSSISTGISMVHNIASTSPIKKWAGLSPKIWLYLAIIAISLIVAIPLLSNNKTKLFAPITNFKPSNSPKIDFQLPQRFSQGEKILISQVTSPSKQLAVAEFAAGNYNKAESLLTTSLETYPNDPEALIYLNNARIGQQKAYLIAAPIPLGSNLNAAQELLRGVAQAQNQVNQNGGIKGVPLKVVIVNDDDNPEVAKQVATKLIQNPQVLGVVGHYASDVTLATAKIYESGKLTAISPISTSIKLSNFSPYVFRTVPSDYIAARALAEYMLEQLGKKNVAIFYSSQSNYSQSLKSEFATAVSLGGGQIVQEFDLSRPHFSAFSSIKQSRNGGAEVLMLAANSGTLDQALQVVQVNDKRLSLLGGDDVYAPKTLEVVGNAAQGMVIAIPWHIKQNLDQEFVKTAYQLWRGDVNWRTAMAYDATEALIAALAHIPNRSGIQKTLSDRSFFTMGASSKVRFSASGDRQKGIQLVEVYKNDNLEFSYEFRPVFSKRRDKN